MVFNWNIASVFFQTGYKSTCQGQREVFLEGLREAADRGERQSFTYRVHLQGHYTARQLSGLNPQELVSGWHNKLKKKKSTFSGGLYA